MIFIFIWYILLEFIFDCLNPVFYSLCKSSFLTITHYHWKKSLQNIRTIDVFLHQYQRLLFSREASVIWPPKFTIVKQNFRYKKWRNFSLILFKMLFKILIFYSKVISIRIHSDFELVLFVEKGGLFSYELVNKTLCLLVFQQANYDDKKRNLLIVFVWNKYNDKLSQILHLYHDYFYFASKYIHVGGPNNWQGRITVGCSK